MNKRVAFREYKRIKESKISISKKFAFSFILVILPILFAKCLLNFQIHQEKRIQQYAIQDKLKKELSHFIEFCNVKDFIEFSFNKIQKNLLLETNNSHGQKLIGQENSLELESKLLKNVKSAFKNEIGFSPILIFIGTPAKDKYLSYADNKYFHGLSKPGKVTIKSFINRLLEDNLSSQSETKKFKRILSNLLGKYVTPKFIEGKANTVFTEKFNGERLYLSFKNFKTNNNKNKTSVFCAFCESQFKAKKLIANALNRSVYSETRKRLKLLPVKQKLGFSQKGKRLSLTSPIPFRVLKQNSFKLKDLATQMIKDGKLSESPAKYPLIELSLPIPNLLIENWKSPTSFSALVLAFLAIAFSFKSEFLSHFVLSIQTRLWLNILLILFFPGIFLFYSLNFYENNQQEAITKTIGERLLLQHDAFDSKLNAFYDEKRKKLTKIVDEFISIKSANIKDLERCVRKNLTDINPAFIILRNDGQFVSEIFPKLRNQENINNQFAFLEKIFLSIGLRILTYNGDANQKAKDRLKSKLKGIDVFAEAINSTDIDSFLLSNGKPLALAQTENTSLQVIPSFHFPTRHKKNQFCYTILSFLNKKEMLKEFLNLSSTSLWFNSNEKRHSNQSMCAFEVETNESSISKEFQILQSWPAETKNKPNFIEAVKNISPNESYKKWKSAGINGFSTLWSARANIEYPVVTVISQEMTALMVQSSMLSLVKIFAIFYALIVFSLIASLLSDSFLTPIQMLKKSSNTLQQGSLLPVPVLKENELGEIIKSFNQMIDGFKKRKLLERFLSEETTNMIVSNEERLEKSHKVILFTHISDFDNLVDNLPPEKVMSLLNAFFGKMEPIVRSQSGEIDKYIGDAMMVTFSEKVGNKSPEYMSCKVAIEMKKNLASLNSELADMELPAIDFGIGIANGIVITGKIGSRDYRKDFTVIGDSVNLAARLESTSHSFPDFFCLVSESVMQKTDNSFEYSIIGKIPIKGKKDPVSIHGLSGKCS